MRLLYIEPRALPTEEPLIDDATLKMVGALRAAQRLDYRFCGVHRCVCGALSDSTDRILPDGSITNTLAAHYLAYHRADVPPSDLEEVRALSPSYDAPTLQELCGPPFRSVPERGLIWTLEAREEERSVDTACWRYVVMLRNLGFYAADVTAASVTLALGGVYGPTEAIQIGRRIEPGATWSLTHVAVFRVPAFQIGRSDAIAASLSLSSRMAALWEFSGVYEDGHPLRIFAEVMATSDRRRFA